MRFVYLVLVFLYVVSPYDLFPDFIAGLGWLDDIVLLILTFRHLLNFKKNSKIPPYNSYIRNTSKGENPFNVLGIEETSSSKKIKEAYRRLANQYHPDKVAHMGYEHYKTAEAKFREIKEAYEKLKDIV